MPTIANLFPYCSFCFVSLKLSTANIIPTMLIRVPSLKKISPKIVNIPVHKESMAIPLVLNSKLCYPNYHPFFLNIYIFIVLSVISIS